MQQLTNSTKEAADLIGTNLNSINTAAKDTQYVLEESQSQIKTLTHMSSNAIKAMHAISEQVELVVDGITSVAGQTKDLNTCLLYTSPSPRDLSTSRMPSSA